MADDVSKRIQALIDKHKILIFMKGSPVMPMCGFKNRKAFCSTRILSEPTRWSTLRISDCDGNSLLGSEKRAAKRSTTGLTVTSKAPSVS